MKNSIERFAISFLWLVISFNASGQKFCSGTDVFFATDKYELSVQSRSKLDSLAQLMNSADFLIEIYGHADSVGNLASNLKLSENRLKAVKEYLVSVLKQPQKFYEKSLGETVLGNSLVKDENLAANRKVEIRLIKLQNGNVVLEGNERVEIPISFFSECGVCNSVPRIKSYYSQQEASTDNIFFQTRNGEELITAGTINITAGNCGFNKNKVLSFSFGIPAEQYDPDMTLWLPDTVKGKIYWRDTGKKPDWDAKEKRYKLKGIPWRFINVDKKLCWHFILPGTFTYLHSFIGKEGSYSEVLQEDTLHYCGRLSPISGLLRVKTFARVGSAFFVCDTLAKYVMDDSINSVRTGYYYKVPANFFKPLQFSDTTLQISFRKMKKPDQFGYYFPEYNEFVPFGNNTKKHYESLKSLANAKLAYLSKTKLYALETGKRAGKTRGKGKVQKIKIKAVYLRNFKWISTFSVRLQDN